MNYSKHYLALITRARTRLCVGKTERHHIIPRCVGGTDEENNIARLTPEEHYVAHQLLVRMYPGSDKLVYAANFMCADRPNNKSYGWIRRLVSEARKGKPLSAEHRAKLSASSTVALIRRRAKCKETGERMTQPYTHKKARSPEHCAAISAAKRGQKMNLTDEQRAHRVALSTGRKFSEESKAKQSASLTGRTISPEHRANIVKAQQARRARERTNSTQ